jgi:hypothetical protein
MSIHKDYNEKLMDFIIEEALPYEVLPIAYVEAGWRVFDPKHLCSAIEPYEFVGLHLADTNDVLTFEEFRPDHCRYIRKFYDINLEETEVAEKIYLKLYSFEWWEFLTMMQTRIHTRPWIYDILNLPFAFNTPLGVKALPLLLEKITRYKIRYNAIQKEYNQKSHYHIAKLLHFYNTEEYEWEAETIFAKYPYEKQISSEEYLAAYEKSPISYGMNMKNMKLADNIARQYRLDIL